MESGEHGRSTGSVITGWLIAHFDALIRTEMKIHIHSSTLVPADSAVKGSPVGMDGHLIKKKGTSS